MRAAEPRGLQLLGAIALSVAVVGFAVGTTDQPADEAAVRQVAQTSDHPEAPSYLDQRRRAAGDGPGWPAEQAALLALTPSRLDEVPATDTSKAEVLAARAARRAYDGAPPTVPHPIRQGGSAECLACHEDGLRIRGATAPAMPHDLHSSCTQCHVAATSPVPGDPEPAPGLPADANTFVGVAAAAAGPRAWSIAPPQVPHTAAMRERCLSCHGVLGQDAMRSTHPWRESCTQCHALSQTDPPGAP